MASILVRFFVGLQWAAALLWPFAPAWAADFSAPVAVNTYRPGEQYLMITATGANGDSAFLWQDWARGGYMFIQRFDAAGTPLQSDDWYVGSGVEGIAVDGQGNFAIAAILPDGNGQGLFVTGYYRDGSVKVPRFRANVLQETGISGLQMAANANGQLALAWSASRSAGWEPRVRTFSAFGAATSPEVVFAGASRPLVTQGVAIDGNGALGVVWLMMYGTGTVDTFFRRFSNSGSPQTGQVMANTYTPSTQANASIAMAPSGATVVTWESTDQDGSQNGLYGQRFDALGQRVGGEFRINDSTAGDQSGSRVGMAADGSFVATWHTDFRAVFMKRYRADGQPAAGEQLVHAPSAPESASFPGVGVSPAGVATIGWRHSTGTGDVDVYARRY
jgi:hypothetical protein